MTGTRTRTPERKGAAAPGVTDVDPDAGTLTAVVAVTGVRDDVGDILVPGCFARTLRERGGAAGIKGVVGHDWSRPVAVCRSAVELLPGDPRLPATTPDGRPWPRQAGALLVKARYILGTPDGRAAWETARAFGAAQAFSIGYRVPDGGAQHKSGTRHIRDLDLYEFSGVLHGANRLAGLQSVKSATPVHEVKAVGTALRSAVSTATCGGCGRPAAGGPDKVPPGRVFLCPDCVDQVDELAEHLAGVRAQQDADDDPDGALGLPEFDDLDTDPDADPDAEPRGPAHALLHHLRCGVCGGPAGAQVGGITPRDEVICPACVAAVDELADDLADDGADDEDRAPSTADEYVAALGEQQEYVLQPDGTISVGDPRTGQAWRTT